ncbi:MAG: hypothetical protein ICV51_12355 [Flavisolibacter sp.]|nr:hypothetical protein [Flavisolibacter sp.]MBD0364728.1 hypothetical protein [Flavisolibacter sp.]MBD0376410.1 hypothetical protein [Flavisolibacter sp.]
MANKQKQQDNLRNEENNENLNTTSQPEPRVTKDEKSSGGDLDMNREGMQNASASMGGTTDMDDEAIAGAGRTNRTERGSGITTKNNVTGSDYDGQISR